MKPGKRSTAPKRKRTPRVPSTRPAGRPPQYPALERVNTTLEPEVKAWLRDFGGGSVAEGIRRCYEALRGE